MREIKIRELIRRYRKAGIVLVTFLLAILMGFSGVQGEGYHPGRARYSDLYHEMHRILRILEPVMKPSAVSVGQKNVGAEVKGLALLIERGIISPLANGSWHPERDISRGEALFYLGRMLEAMEGDLIHPPIMLKIPETFADVQAGHWLYTHLTKLSGIGALANFSCNHRLNPDAVIHPEELRGISSAMIEYLGSNLLIVDFDGISGRVIAKGALDELKISEWEYSSNRRDWYHIGRDGLIEPEFTTGRMGSVFFRHQSYREAGPFLVKEGSPAIGMIKLQRNYADFTSNRFAAHGKAKAADTEEEKERIRLRLAQLLERSSNKVNSIVPRQALPERIDVAAVSGRSREPLPKTDVVNHTDMKQYDMPDVNACESDNTVKQPVESEYTASIVDALTSEPLTGAAVIIADRQITADKAGKVSFAASPGSILDVTVYSEGYEALKIRHRAGYRDGPLNFALKPIFASCSGRITSFADASPVARALVKIGNRATRTSADGSFVLRGIRPGFHQVSVFAGNFMETHEIAHIGAESQQVIDMQLRPVISADSEFLTDYQTM
ncbi:MAG: hypothetical protein CVV42_10025 [Candidatus Riflebacteria bacterium HGW-Riflebacteria-2]|jgi:hypothetical protein|nr:MAG: hypothetical protein CVV42_10025 [Candidatus Riflebacteria bacterium HGW-Riflebacteria-2]